MLAQFWAGALGWQVVRRSSYGVSIGVGGGPFEIDFRSVPDGPKLTKNRLHLDVKPVNRDQAAELSRLFALGARQAGVGQGDRNWVVLPTPRPMSSASAVPDAMRQNERDHAIWHSESRPGTRTQDRIAWQRTSVNAAEETADLCQSRTPKSNESTVPRGDVAQPPPRQRLFVRLA